MKNPALLLCCALWALDLLTLAALLLMLAIDNAPTAREDKDGFHFIP